MASKVRMSFDTQPIGGAVNTNIDLALDGKRMMALLSIEAKGAPEAQNHVLFLLNFFDAAQSASREIAPHAINGGTPA